MADIANTKSGGNKNNSTEDPRIIWEDGQFAIIEGRDCWDGLERSKTRDNLGDAVKQPIAGPMPKPGAGKATDLVKVKLADMLANPAAGSPQAAPLTKKPLPSVASYREAQNKDAVAPPSPFMPKPYTPKNIPEFPHQCTICGGRFYLGLTKAIHQDTEADPKLKGDCPGAKAEKKGRLLRA